MLARYNNRIVDGDINRERYHDDDFEDRKNKRQLVDDIYGEDLDPNRNVRIIRAKNFERQHIVDTHNPALSNLVQHLLLKCLNLEKTI